MIDIPMKELMWVSRNMPDLVTEYTVITNKGKKARLIQAPERQLKFIQRLILDRIIPHVPVNSAAHGFVTDRGIVSNAQRHLGQKVVVNIDLRNFFPSITASRVFAVWHRVFGFSKSQAWLLTQLTTFNGKLTQGFPTSPALANIIAGPMDDRLTALAASKGLTYTRYADDLTFSGEGQNNMDWLVKAVTQIAADCGFEVHPEKTAIMRSGRRQKVTGLVVNGAHEQPRVQASVVDRLRAQCFNFAQQTPSMKQEILGWISFINSVNPQKAAMLRQQIEKGALKHNG
jgi:retron-type reverse transcriptase